jgi:hypothetical protein
METVNRIWNSSVYGPSVCTAVLTVTGQAMYVRIYATFSRVNTVVGKSEHITYSEYVSVACYPARNAHAPCYIGICGLFGSTVFYHIIS